LLKKSRSQNFLTDSQLLQKEAKWLGATGIRVLEIGAGDGRLSEQILTQNPSRLTLVELDSRFAQHLHKRFEKEPRVEVYEGDFLQMDGKWKTEAVAGNIPYQITSPILLKLAKWKPKCAVLCMQKEVAERIMAPAGTKEYGRLSVFMQANFEIEIMAIVPRGKFTPAPKVDSAIVRLTPNPNAEGLPANFEEVSAALFSHRLQTVASALVHERRRWGWSREEARAWASKLNIGHGKVMHQGVWEIVKIARQLPSAEKIE